MAGLCRWTFGSHSSEIFWNHSTVCVCVIVMGLVNLGWAVFQSLLVYMNFKQVVFERSFHQTICERVESVVTDLKFPSRIPQRLTEISELQYEVRDYSLPIKSVLFEILLRYRLKVSSQSKEDGKPLPHCILCTEHIEDNELFVIGPISYSCHQTCLRGTVYSTEGYPRDLIKQVSQAFQEHRFSRQETESNKQD